MSSLKFTLNKMSFYVGTYQGHVTEDPKEVEERMLHRLFHHIKDIVDSWLIENISIG